MKLEATVLDPDALKSKLKASAISATGDAPNLYIRAHRAISWYRRAMSVASTNSYSSDLAEARLLFLWIALSALFGKWDPETQHPSPEGEALRSFIDQIIAMDSDHAIADALGRSRALATRLIENPFLYMEFWVDACNPKRAEKQARAEDYFDHHLDGRKAAVLLRDVLFRVYTLRGQIVHGASTSGSKLNRKSLRDSIRFLQEIVPVLINLVIERGEAVEWPPLCYPPVKMQGR